MKTKISNFVILSCICVLSGCGLNGSSLGSSVDYRMFENQEETQKLFDEIVARLGNNAKATDEVKIYINRPSVEGHIKRQGDPDNLNIMLDTQHPSKPTRIQRTNYYSEYNGWRAPEEVEISVSGSDAESFRLEDELFDFNQIKFETLYKVIQDAYAKYKDTEKFQYQYISDITIKQNDIEVQIFGKLASNEQEKHHYYHADFEGKSKK